MSSQSDYQNKKITRIEIDSINYTGNTSSKSIITPDNEIVEIDYMYDKKCRERYYITHNDKMIRGRKDDTQPSTIIYQAGEPVEKHFFKNGLIYLSLFCRKEEVFWKDYYNENRERYLSQEFIGGKCIAENRYIKNNVHHSLDGPAFIRTYPTHVYTRYYILGQNYSKERYNKVAFFIRLFINKNKSVLRRKLADILKEGIINKTNGPDICELISKYIY